MGGGATYGPAATSCADVMVVFGSVSDRSDSQGAACASAAMRPSAVTVIMAAILAVQVRSLTTKGHEEVDTGGKATKYVLRGLASSATAFVCFAVRVRRLTTKGHEKVDTGGKATKFVCSSRSCLERNGFRVLRGWRPVRNREGKKR